LVAQAHQAMSEARWWLAFFFGGFGVSMLVYIWNRLGRVRFHPSDWRMGFWESSHPPGGPLLVFPGDDNRTSPDRAAMMECSFSVRILNGKRVDTTLQRVTGVFHLPGGSKHSAKIYDPQAGNILESLYLPAKQPVTKELWIHIYVSDVGRDVMVKLDSTERVVFDARHPFGWRYRKQIYPTEPGRPWWRRGFGG
jgi:hypothetical protein